MHRVGPLQTEGKTGVKPNFPKEGCRNTVLESLRSRRVRRPGPTPLWGFTPLLHNGPGTFEGLGESHLAEPKHSCRLRPLTAADPWPRQTPCPFALPPLTS